MAAKKEFDYMVLSIGYEKFAVPKAAALQFLELCAGSDIYKLEHQWDGGASEYHALMLTHDKMPSVSVIGPAQFHQALLMREAYEARKAAAEREKNSGA